ncbi:AMP-binding protein [Rhodococcus pseudokoreensis]|uniref:AMP-binding protein n=1 Tax=Rhodococcus pseudokoreensis TaxID=2811421 RepID=A0A974ZUY0_9NOCA|nr:AMP-binding protein [Rhodococcus pseudokoreensis]QSE90792.1 AMP-binding protein [Rhodococcus pseudokoreensis]
MTTSHPPDLLPYLVEGALGFWEIAEKLPDRGAIVSADGTTLSFGALRRWSDSIANELIRLGYGPGDTVASMFPNVPASLAVQLATSQLGIVLTPINWHQTAGEVEYILRDSGATALFTDAELADLVLDVGKRVPMDPERLFATGTGLTGFRSLTDLPDSRPVDAHRRVMGQSMYYTSGTTGRPKGVVRPTSSRTPEEVLAVRHPLTARRMGWPAAPGVHLVTAPLYHSGPNNYAYSALQRGYQVVLVGKWDAEECLRTIEAHHVTSSFMVPTMFHRLLALPEDIRSRYDTSSLNFVVHAAAPCPPHEKRAMLDWWGPVVYEFYSSTEGGGTSVGPQDWIAHPGTVGRAWEGVDVKVFDDAGNELPPGEVGMVFFRNPERFMYHNAPEKTAEAQQGEFFTAGDMGRLDEDGWLFLADRRSDLIISGGVNIYPAEIEAVLLEHPAVSDAAVVGLPDEVWGSRVHAVISPAEGVVPGPQLQSDLEAHWVDRLASFKRPRSIEFRALSRTDTGKLNRSALRASVLAERAD